MEPFNTESDAAIVRSLLEPLAKSSSILRDARNDITKTLDKVSFALALVNELIERQNADNQGD